MPKRIDVGDQILEFPDDMPDSEITTVLRKQFPPQSKPAKSEPTFGSRLYETTVGPLVDMGSAMDQRAKSKKGSPLAAVGEVGLEALTGMAKGIYDRFASSPQTKAGNPVGGAIDALVRPVAEPIVEDVKAGRYDAAAGGLLGNVAMTYGPKVVGRVAQQGIPVARRLQQSALNPASKFNEAQVARLVDESLEQGVTATNRAKATALRKQATRAVRERVAEGEAQGFKVDPNVAAQEIERAKMGARGTQSDAARDLALIDAKTGRILEQAGARPGTPEIVQRSPVLDAYGRPIDRVTPAVPPKPADLMSFSEAQARKQADYKVNQKVYGANPADVPPAAEAEALANYDRGIKQQMEALDPALGPMNETSGARIDLEKVVKRTAQQYKNSPIFGMKDLVTALSGFGVTALSGGITAGLQGAATLAIARKVLTNPAVKSRLAITIYDAAKASGNAVPFAQATARATAIINNLMPKSGAEMELDAIKNKEKK